jgi:glycosyltransferase involved in cell wall biosynthesis
MTVSVAIPAYNCEATIRQTLDSVLRQTVPAEEILVLNDGSTDGTSSILDSYGADISVIWQPNGGVASALNSLCQRAQGDLVAVLGSDDIWHPRYLELQRMVFRDYPHAVAFFTGHANFSGDGDYKWDSDPFEHSARVEIIAPLQFLRRYNAAPGPFMCMSHCCIPKRVLTALGSEPFKLRMAEDLYFFNLVAPSGPIAFVSKPMAAYRIRHGSLSSNRVRLNESEVQAFELLEKHYAAMSDRRLVQAFRWAFTSKRRLFAKTLMGVGNSSEARRQLRRSLSRSSGILCFAKSAVLLCLTFLPRSLQPQWPSGHRRVDLVQSRTCTGEETGRSDCGGESI